ncbi:hypothetical protein [Leadbetterella byssophila]|uniref:hypothetical protein n=1 Tax=Leadbetterella byssophila TaxID=316068 RepID=UPI0039A30BA8
MIRLLFLCILWLGFSVSASAQRYYGVSKERFGKSKLQTKEFQWKTFSSANFEFNFYKGGESLARNAATHLENSYSRITNILGYIPYEPVKVFVFNHPQDLQSSNLISNQKEEKYVVDAKHGRILAAFDKNDSLFNRNLVESIANIYVYEMLYGGSIRESLESQILLNLPEWYSQGICAYVAEVDNTAQFEKFKMYISAAQSKRLKSLKGEEAEVVGQSIWHFIALKYGKDNISNILNLTRIIHDEQSSITSTLGVSFSKFMQEWTDFYLKGVPVHAPEAQEKPVEVVKPVKRFLDLKPGEVDTDDYIFNEENVLKYKEARVAPTTAATRASRTETPGVAKLSAVKSFKNFLVSNERKIDVLVDPVRQFGIGYGLSFNDVLQNHIFSFNSYLRPSTPLFKNFDFDLSYGNYSGKVDWLFKYEKRSINFETVDDRDAFLFRPLNRIIYEDTPEYLQRRLVQQRISVSMLYPFSEKWRLEVTPAVVKNDDIDYGLTTKDGVPSDFYIAPQVSLVYDNTKLSHLGVETGTKAKVVYDQYFHTSNTLRSFKNAYIDVRHYQRILPGLQIAGRLSYGTSRGNAPKFTFLGGAENGLNRSTYKSDEMASGGDPDLKNILLYQFPGNLRGFDFGRLYGNNHLLGNVELRSHLIEILPQMALSSNLLRNLQIVGFYDIGTAWMGSKGPFSRQNSLNTTVIGQGQSFVIEVTNFKNPFLSGFGGGLRTTVLGVFLRADYAWGWEDRETHSPKFHLSVGKDF